MRRITRWKRPYTKIDDYRWDDWLVAQAKRMGADNCIIVLKMDDLINNQRVTKEKQICSNYFLAIYIKEEWDDYNSRLGQDGNGE